MSLKSRVQKKNDESIKSHVDELEKIKTLMWMEHMLDQEFRICHRKPLNYAAECFR